MLFVPKKNLFAYMNWGSFRKLTRFLAGSILKFISQNILPPFSGYCGLVESGGISPRIHRIPRRVMHMRKCHRRNLRETSNTFVGFVLPLTSEISFIHFNRSREDFRNIFYHDKSNFLLMLLLSFVC